MRFFKFFLNMALNDYEIETFLNIPIESEDEYADGFELSDDENINEVNNKYTFYIGAHIFAIIIFIGNCNSSRRPCCRAC